MSLLAASLIALLSSSPSPTLATVEITVQNLRNERGLLHVCATRNPAHFPDCRRDPSAFRQSVPAASKQLLVTGMPPGRYALSLFHDQNSNSRLDTFLGVPR
jgi:uncharacterized protein (DUF2141 family)